MGKKKQGKKNGKQGKKNGKQQEKRGDVDVFENPVAIFEDEADAAEANAATTFEDDSKPTHLARADVIAAAGASILTDTDPVKKGCCSWLLVPTLATKGGGSSSASSIVQFDAMQLMDKESLDPQLHDHTGELVSFAQPKLKVSKKNLVKPQSIDGDGEDEEQSAIAQLESELADLQKEIQKRHQWEEGRPVSIKRKEENRLLMEQVKQAEASLKKEKARVHEENEVALAAADLAAESKAAQRLHSAGTKVMSQGRGVVAMGNQANVFTINEQGPLGIDWNYQDGRPVVAGIRDGGCAENVHGLRIGMVLSQYRQPRLGQKTSVGYDQIKKAAEERTARRDGEEITPGEVVEYLKVCLEVVGRPLQLVFKKPDVAKAAEGDALQRQHEERNIGCKIVDLEYVVPHNGLALGGVFFKSKEGTVLCDITADSVLATEDFLKQGMRPGLLLKEIKTADGLVRSMRRDDYSYLQAMKQLAVAERPFVCTFEPRAVPMEFTLDDSSADKTVPSPTSDADSQYTRHCRGLTYNIFRHLGLSLREEILIVAGSNGGSGSLSTYGSSAQSSVHWRCRVSGIIPGGMIDRFNRHHMRGWITPGMTVTTIQSPFLKLTNVDGMKLSQVVKLFHRAAAGHKVTSTDKEGNKIVFSGKTITLGFEVTERATLPSMELAVPSSSEEDETESESDEEHSSSEEEERSDPREDSTAAAS